jgi:hypothetical protein
LDARDKDGGAMLKILSRLFSGRNARNASAEFDPLYGLSKQSLEEWLSFNPQLRKEYESELRARSLRAREWPSIENAQRRHTALGSRAGNDPIDVSSEDSFPASDAPSWTGVMGTGPPPPQTRENADGVDPERSR